MLNSRQARRVLVYGLVNLFFTTYPVLAQGEKFMELDNETIKFVEIALIVISVLLITITLFLAIRDNSF